MRKTNSNDLYKVIAVALFAGVAIYDLFKCNAIKRQATSNVKIGVAK